MNTEGDASGAQGSGQPRRSPRVALQGQQQLNTYKRKDRKKRLRLPTPQPDVDSEVHEEQEDRTMNNVPKIQILILLVMPRVVAMMTLALMVMQRM